MSAKDAAYGVPAGIVAAAQDQVEVARLLAEHGIDLSAKDEASGKLMTGILTPLVTCAKEIEADLKKLDFKNKVSDAIKDVQEDGWSDVLLPISRSEEAKQLLESIDKWEATWAVAKKSTETYAVLPKYERGIQELFCNIMH